MNQKVRSGVLLGIALVAFTLAAPALAQEAEPERTALVSTGQWHLEFYGGLYDPKGAFDEDAVYGIRFGRQVGERVFLEGNIGYWESDAQIDSSRGRVRVDIETLVFDGSVGAIFRTQTRVNPILYGGAGFHTGEVDNTVIRVTGIEAPSFPDTPDEGLTLHVGTGLKFQLDRRVYLRVETLLRWYQEREGDDIDKEVTFGLGLKF